MEFKEKLEIRGIDRKDLISYLEDIGGEQDPVQNSFVVIKNDQWICELSSQEVFLFMHSEIPKVSVLFQATTKESLDDILKQFRKKTFRAGG